MFKQKLLLVSICLNTTAVVFSSEQPKEAAKQPAQQSILTSMGQFPTLSIGARPVKPVRMAKPSDAATIPVQDRSSSRQRSVSPSAVITSIAAASTESVGLLPESPTRRVRSVSPIAKEAATVSSDASVAAPLREASRSHRSHSSSPTVGADGSSRSPRRKSGASDVSAEMVSFATAGAASQSIFSSTYDSDNDSDYEKPTVCSGKQMDIRTVRGAFEPGVGDKFRDWHFNTALATLRATENFSKLTGAQRTKLLRDCEKGLVEASEDRNRFSHKEFVELVGLIRGLNVPIGHVHFGNAFTTCDELLKDRALRLKQTMQSLGQEIRELEDAKVKALRSYGDCGGTGSVSPRADYGMGPKFTDKEVESHQKLLAKVYAMDLEDTVRK